MAKDRILIDSGFWIALYTQQDVLHSKAVELISILESNHVVVPWPTLYEFVNTRLARRKENLISFQQFLLKPNVFRISDDIYKEVALQNVFELNRSHSASISLIDEIIRQIILDRNIKIDYFVTYNRKDFEYPCQIANVKILD